MAYNVGKIYHQLYQNDHSYFVLRLTDGSFTARGNGQPGTEVWIKSGDQLWKGRVLYLMPQDDQGTLDNKVGLVRVSLSQLAGPPKVGFPLDETVTITIIDGNGDPHSSTVDDGPVAEPELDIDDTVQQGGGSGGP